jgi:hypothetical protein
MVFYSVLVDASDQCNMLNFQLGNNGQGTSIPAARSWNIKVIIIDRVMFLTF